MAKQSIVQKFTEDIGGVVEVAYAEAKRITKAKVGVLAKQLGQYSQGAEAADIASRYLSNGTIEISDKDGEKVGEYVSLLQKVVSFNIKYKDAKDKSKEVPGLRKQVASLDKAKTRFKTQLDNQKEKYAQQIAELEAAHKKEEYVLDAIAKLRAKPVSVYERAAKYSLEEGKKPQGKSDKPNGFEKLRALTFYDNKPTQATQVLYDILSVATLKVGVEEASDQFIKDMKLIVSGKSPDDDSGNGSKGNGGKKKSSKKKKD